MGAAVVNVFVGSPFWSVLAAAAGASWIIRQTQNTRRVSTRLLCIVVIQILLLKFGLMIPFMTIAAWIMLSAVIYKFVICRRTAALIGVLAIVVAFVALTRSPFFSLPVFSRAFHGRVATAGAFLAVGASYAALRYISFAFDYKNGKIKQLSFRRFLSYIFFAPAFVAGPIDRYPHFAHVFFQPMPFSTEMLFKAITRISVGAFKKFVLAGILSCWVLTTQETAHLAVCPVKRLWVGLYAYSWLLYIDFSAYSDLAVGCGYLFGLELPENFSWPYLRRNIIEFWNHWHMSLTFWLRDYLFFPIGQRLFRVRRLSANPVLISGICYLITMAFCGIWHGFAPHFLLWGLYHGIGLWGYKNFRNWFSAHAPSGWSAAWNDSLAGYWTSVAINYHFVAFGWLLFVYEMPQSVQILKRMVGGAL